MSVGTDATADKHDTLPPGAITRAAGGAQRADLEPVLDQADRYDRDLLPVEVTAALGEHHRLRDEHRATYRFHNMMWRSAEKAHDRDRADDRER